MQAVCYKELQYVVVLSSLPCERHKIILLYVFGIFDVCVRYYLQCKI